MARSQAGGIPVERSSRLFTRGHKSHENGTEREMGSMTLVWGGAVESRQTGNCDANCHATLPHPTAKTQRVTNRLAQFLENGHNFGPLATLCTTEVDKTPKVKCTKILYFVRV